MYFKYKEVISVLHIDPDTGELVSEFKGYRLYQIFLVLSTIVALILLITIISVVIPAWILMYKNRNNVDIPVIAPLIQEGQDRLLNDDQRR